MRREIAGLIEAARGLRLKLDPQPGDPLKVRIGGGREDFMVGLHGLAVALENLDRSGSASTDITPADDPSLEPANLRAALDGVFRWLKATGVDITEPHAIVAEALGAKQKRTAAYTPMPKFVHSAFRSRKRPGPLLNIGIKPGEKVDIDVLRKKAQEIVLVEATLGNAAPRIR
jgi:hypothetical protein